MKTFSFWSETPVTASPPLQSSGYGLLQASTLRHYIVFLLLRLSWPLCFYVLYRMWRNNNTSAKPSPPGPGTNALQLAKTFCSYCFWVLKEILLEIYFIDMNENYLRLWRGILNLFPQLSLFVKIRLHRFDSVQLATLHFAVLGHHKRYSQL